MVSELREQKKERSGMGARFDFVCTIKIQRDKYMVAIADYPRNN